MLFYVNESSFRINSPTSAWWNTTMDMGSTRRHSWVDLAATPKPCEDRSNVKLKMWVTARGISKTYKGHICHGVDHNSLVLHGVLCDSPQPRFQHMVSVEERLLCSRFHPHLKLQQRFWVSHTGNTCLLLLSLSYGWTPKTFCWSLFTLRLQFLETHFRATTLSMFKVKYDGLPVNTKNMWWTHVHAWNCIKSLITEHILRANMRDDLYHLFKKWISWQHQACYHSLQLWQMITVKDSTILTVAQRTLKKRKWKAFPKAPIILITQL